MERDDQTSAFLGPKPHWATASIELSAIQGLWGGRNIYVAGPGRVVVKLVGSGMLERRYQFDLDAAEWTFLLAAFVEKEFLTIRPPERAGLPDEARPRISLVNAGGERHSVSKWAHVRDERFEGLYSRLIHLDKLALQLKPVYMGPYDDRAQPKPG